MKRNVVIACGGTGGHLFPGVAVGESLHRRGHEVMLIVSRKRIDEVAVAGHGEFEVRRVATVGLPKWYSPAIVLFATGVLSGIGQCRGYFRKFRPDAVLGMGGFTSTAPLVAGRMAGAATFIHESNVIPGKANRFNARFAKTALLGFEEAARRLGSARYEVTGTPVRTALTAHPPRDEALRKLGLSASRPVVLAMGGSQGASGINHALFRIAGDLAALDLQVIHLTGERDEVRAREVYESAGIPAHVAPFSHDMAEVYAAADFAVARSGASSLSELAYFGLPSILVPYPYAAEDHQWFNAEAFAADGGAVVFRETSDLSERLVGEIALLCRDPGRRERMSEAVRGHHPELAADRIAEVVESGCQAVEDGG